MQESRSRLAAAYLARAEELFVGGDASGASNFAYRCLAVDASNARARQLLERLHSPTAPQMNPSRRDRTTPSLTRAPNLTRIKSAGGSRSLLVAAMLASLLALIAVVALLANRLAEPTFMASMPDIPSTTIATPISELPVVSNASCSLAESAPRVIAATVRVETADGGGTAFHLGNGVFVTAAHVVSGSKTVTLQNGTVRTRRL